jgi:hypothetical protein
MRRISWAATGLALAAVAVAVAFADVTVSKTYNSANARVVSIEATFLPDAGVAVAVCGNTTVSGVRTDVSCTKPIELGNTGAQGTL